jgi:membrane-bound metal-dependent hydrolase YbcI (DUF457 family)
MDWRSHVFIGAILGLAVFLILGQDIFALMMLTAFSALSALVPDLDHDSSKGRQWLDVAFVGFAFMTVYGSACGTGICLPALSGFGAMIVTFLAMAGVYFLFFRFLKPRHRGITHTLVACFAFGVLLYFMTGRMLALAGIVGYASHLIADQHIRLI